MNKNSEQKNNNHLIGQLKLHPDGYGFIIADKPSQEDVFIPAKYVGDALHGDIVEVSFSYAKKGLEGKIIRIVKRGIVEMIGRFEKVNNSYRVVSDDRRVRRHLVVESAKDIKDIKNGQYVLAKITKYPDGDNPMRGIVLKMLGKRGEANTEIESIIVKNQLMTEFSEQTMNFRDVCEKRMSEGLNDKSRRDFRDMDFVTIDGETAKDFDDAVFAERMENNHIKLFVAIADVSWFVSNGTSLNDEAYERGTSVYFPNMCIPMLPEYLSTELCSLNPESDRLVLVAEMEIDLYGNVLKSSFHRAIINSRRRLTYTEVSDALEEKKEGVRQRLLNLLPMLEVIYECSSRLKKMRKERGSIDFDLPEPEVVIGITGEIENMMKAKKFESHMVIESLMICANEAVARFLQPACVFRVHEPPTRKGLKTLSEFLTQLGFNIKIGKNITPKKIANLLNKIKGSPEEIMINNMVLRSMSQAVYSTENLGHFGLASVSYCHFTSPIRRYPDLMVHRFLSAKIKSEKSNWNSKKFERMSEHCSRRERIAMEAEREIIKFYSSKFMEHKVGDEFVGAVSHLGRFGMFVQLKDFYVEGIIPIEEIGVSARFNEKTRSIDDKSSKRRYVIGDRVKIRVESVDVVERQTVFSIIK